VDLKQIRYFIYVANLGSFNKAARVLNIAQPALSRQIRALEDELRVQLLHRSTRGVETTDAGKTLLKMGESILAYADQIRESVSRVAVTPTGNVIIGMPPSISAVFASTVIEATQRVCPEVTLRITEGLSVFLEEWLNLGKIDIAVMTHPGDVPTLNVSRLCDEEMVLVGNTRDMAALGETIELKRLAEMPLTIAHGFKLIIEPFTRERGIELNYVMELDSIAILMETIMRGLGRSILPYASVHQAASRGEVGIARIVNPVVTRPLVVAINGRRPLTAAIEAVRDVVVGKIGELVVRPESSRRRRKAVGEAGR